MDDLKAKFLKVYAGIPLGLRDDIVMVLGADDEPVTWRAAFIEVNRDTTKANEILQKLSDLDII